MRHDQVSAGRDVGTTMIELFVAMIIMSICGAVFTGAVVTLYRTTDAAQAVTTSAQQNNQAYQTLDRTVRYASAISTPAKSTVIGGTGDWYVELRNTTDGTERCTQLRLDIGKGQLQRRTWSSADKNPANATFLPLASGLVNGSAVSGANLQPFKISYPSREVLTVTLQARAGTASDPKTSLSTFALTAINSPITSISTPPTNVCQQAGRP